MSEYSINKYNSICFNGKSIGGSYSNKFDAELVVWRMFRPSDCMVGKFRIVQRPNEDMYTVTLNDEWVYDGNNYLVRLWLEFNAVHIHKNLMFEAEKSINNKWAEFARNEISSLKNLAKKYHKKTRKALPKRK
jgi:hypothetical protein